MGGRGVERSAHGSEGVGGFREYAYLGSGRLRRRHHIRNTPTHTHTQHTESESTAEHGTRRGRRQLTPSAFACVCLSLWIGSLTVSFPRALWPVEQAHEHGGGATGAHFPLPPSLRPVGPAPHRARIRLPEAHLHSHHITTVPLGVWPSPRCVPLSTCFVCVYVCLSVCLCVCLCVFCVPCRARLPRRPTEASACCPAHCACTAPTQKQDTATIDSVSAPWLSAYPHGNLFIYYVD